MPHYIIEKGGLPDTYQIDKNGINGLSEHVGTRLDELNFEMPTSQDQKSIRKNLAAIRGSHNDDNFKLGKAHIERKLNISSDVKVVVFFGAWDVAAGIKSEQFGRSQSPYFVSSQAALLALNEVVASRDDCKLLYKMHPCDRAGRESLALLGSNAVDASDYNAIDLIQLAEVVCGLQSSLLYMACALGKPILLLGKTILSSKDIAYEYGSNGENMETLLRQALQKEGWDRREKNRDRFFNWYVSSFCYTNEKAIAVGVGQGADELADVFRRAMYANPQPVINRIDAWEMCASLWAQCKKEWVGESEVGRILHDISKARNSPLGRIIVYLKSVFGFRAVGKVFNHAK
jgi:hypothetical protein